jgi:hypothetical protein
MSKKNSAPATAPRPAVQQLPIENVTLQMQEPAATSRLFPETTPITENVPHGTIEDAPVPAPVVTPPPAPVAPEPVVPPVVPATPPPAAPAPAASDDTFLEDLLAKSNIPLDKVKVRLKVDGVDQVMSYEEAKMRVQLKEHLNLAGAKLGEDRRAIAEERKKFQEEQRTVPNLGVPRAPTPGEPTPEDLANPLVRTLYDEVMMLKGRMQGLDPVVFDTNRQRVANELKAQGFPDFLDYIPKIEAHIATVKDPRYIEYYDSEVGSKALYHELKSRDLMEQMAKANRPPTPAPVPPAAPPANAPIITIDGGQNPAQDIVVDNYDAQYQDVLERWKQSRDPKLFRQLLKMRGASAPA